MTKEEIINKLKVGDTIETTMGIGKAKRIIGFHENRFDGKKLVIAEFDKRVNTVYLDDIISIIEENKQEEETK